MRKKFDKECEIIEQNCTYTAEAHHIVALRNKKLSDLFQIVPAVVAAILGVLVGSDIVPFWIIWLSVISAVISAVGNVLNPMKEYYDNLNVAKNFTAMKHSARALKDVFSSQMEDGAYEVAVQTLHDRYSDLVRFAPPTDKKSLVFMEGISKIATRGF